MTPVPATPVEVLRELIELADTPIDDTGEWVLRVLDVVEHARTVLAGEVETRTETRVTGDPGPDYPPYEFVTDDPDKLVALLREGSGFRSSVKDIRVETREVSTTPWRPVPTPEGGQRNA